jgi:hypothetical protein
LTALYQAEADKFTISAMPAGDPVDLTPEDLPSCDGIASLAAHLGRGWLLTNWLDASVIDEDDALAVRPVE